VLTLFLFFLAADTAPQQPAPAPPARSVQPVEEHDEAPPDLSRVRRIYVDVFTGGESAARMRELIMGALQRSKAFVITENEERADAILRGAAKDEAYTDRFHSSENANGRAQYGSSSGEGYGHGVTSRAARNIGGNLGESETVDIEERKHEATAAVRLVTPDGDLIWSTTQESHGAKFLSASEDVAQRVARQLASDYRHDRALKGAQP
jgi:hypothetical protein